MYGYEELRALVNEALERYFKTAEELPQKNLAKAMRYSLLAGGKRLRPVLVLAFCQALGGDVISAVPTACAVEMLHTYSLIHDDLPCMDNDELRRGKPTNHVVFGECTAVLAGDALQAEAFGAILRSGLSAEKRAACAEALADAAGLDGICGGQQMDMEGEERPLSEEELKFMISGKTASLIICACRMGAIIGGADEAQLDAACSYGGCVGSAFQIKDDMLDVLASTEVMGKTSGTDSRDGKTTYMSLLGQEKCESMVQKLTAAAKEQTKLFPNGALLAEIADMMGSRSC